MTEYGSVEVSWKAAASVLLLLCALGASSAEGATCLVDAATGNDLTCSCGTVNACKTIQKAINNAAALDTISVAAGTYPETGAPLAINKTLILHGAQFGVDARTRVGAESIISDSQGTSVSASNVVIDGFTIQNSTNAAFTGYGIWLNPTVSGTTVINNIFQNNIAGLGIANAGAAPTQLLIRHNLFQSNNQPGGASGTGIYTDQFVGGATVTNVLIEENAFKSNNNSGIDLSNTCADTAMPVAPCVTTGNGVFNIEVRNNTFDMNGRAFDIFNTHVLSFHDNDVTNSTLAGSAALRIFDGNSDVTIVNNNLIGGVANGIRLTDLSPADCNCQLGPSSKVEIHLNNITPFTLDGLVVDAGSHVGSVNATCNWWGSATGPFNAISNPTGTGEPVVGDAIFDCWLIDLAPDGPCCFPTPTVTPTITPTSTPTATPTGPGTPGSECTDPSQCNGNLFCVDDVCCDTPCDRPSESCVLPDHVGMCSRPRIVPATSGLAQVAIIGLLVAMGWLGLRALRRGREG